MSAPTKKQPWQRVHEGKTWKDMPGNCVDAKRMNFYLWRKGELALTEDGRAPGWMEAAKAAKKSQLRRAAAEKAGKKAPIRTPKHTVLVSGYAPMRLPSPVRVESRLKKTQQAMREEAAARSTTVFSQGACALAQPQHKTDGNMKKQPAEDLGRDKKTGRPLKLSRKFDEKLFGGPVLPADVIEGFGTRERVKITAKEASAIKARSAAARIQQGLSWPEFHSTSNVAVAAFYGICNRARGQVNKRQLHRLMLWLDSVDGLGALKSLDKSRPLGQRPETPAGGRPLGQRPETVPQQDQPEARRAPTTAEMRKVQEVLIEMVSDGGPTLKETMERNRPAVVPAAAEVIKLKREMFEGFDDPYVKFHPGTTEKSADEAVAEAMAEVPGEPRGVKKAFSFVHTADVVPLWLDVETTGLEPERCAIVEIAARLWYDREDPWFFHAPIDWQHEVNRFLLDVHPEAMKLNGADKPDWPGPTDVSTPMRTMKALLRLAAWALKDRFSDWVEDRMRRPLWICGANPQFDVDFLNETCRRHDLPDLARRGLDVQQEALALLWDGRSAPPLLRSNQLSSALGLAEEKKPHRAVAGVAQAIAIHTAVKQEAAK